MKTLTATYFFKQKENPFCYCFFYESKLCIVEKEAENLTYKPQKPLFSKSILFSFFTIKKKKPKKNIIHYIILKKNVCLEFHIFFKTFQLIH